MQRDAEHAGDVRERGGDVVAVADERHARGRGNRPSASRMRHHVGERLAGMLLVGQRVDDVEPWRRRRQQHRPLLRERPDARARAPSVRGCGRRLRAVRGRLANSADRFSTSPPSSWTAISNVDRVRSDGFSKSSATCLPSSAAAVGAAPAEPAVGLQLQPPRSSSRHSVGRCEIEDREEVLACRQAAGGWLDGAVTSGTRR